MIKQRDCRYGSSFVGPACVFLTCTMLFASRAEADPSASERAAAEALFQQGTSLMSEKQFAKACEKFEGSNQLDPALGTMLRLADCYDRTGKTASAWAVFRESASVAHSRSEPERQKIAVDRAADLEKRLSRIELKTDAKTAPNGMEIRLNGSLVPRASWDAPIPVDPGRQQIDASAPERAPWSTTVNVGDGPAVQPVEVPTLTLKSAGSVSTDRTTVSVVDSTPARGRTQRTIGYVMGGVALAGLATSGFFTWRAYDMKQQSLNHCRPENPNACTQEGVDQRSDARRAATVATVALAVGAPLLAAGLVVLLSSPHGEAAHASAPVISPTVIVVGRGATFGLRGQF
jgi:hypothetical protein